MNSLVKHFFFSTIKTQVREGIKVKTGGDVGELISVSFIVEKDKITQRVKLERYEGYSILTPEEKKSFEKMLGLSIDNEVKDCKNILVQINCEKSLIVIRKNYFDKESKTITF